MLCPTCKGAGVVIVKTPTPAHSSHPVTSQKAAASVNYANAQLIHVWLLQLLDRCGPQTHEEIATLYWADRNAPKATSSGLRTRMSELVRGKVVHNSGRTRTMSTGREAIVWERT